MLKKLFFLSMWLFFFFPNLAFAESIRNFDVEYNLPKSAVVEVTESIVYDFGNLSKHGIYRYIPYRYQLDGGGTHRINISDFKVRDEKGRGYSFEKTTQNNNVVLKIGDSDRTLTGVHTYIVSYKVKGAIRYYDDGDEFYWNVNGLGWNVPITKASAKVTFPDGIAGTDVRLACWVGDYGAEAECESKSAAGGVATFSAGNLRANEGLTIDVGVPAGTFEIVDAGFMGTGLSDAVIGFMVLVALGIVFLTLIFMLRHWWKYGRDPKGRGTIVTEYNPPDGLTPIEVGTLLDNRVDNRDLSAEIIYLATKGYLKIKKEEKKILKTQDYTLIKLAGGKGADSVFDSTLMTGIFGTSDEVKMSSLKNDFYTHVVSIKDQVHDKLVKDDYFKSKVTSTIGKYIAIAVGVAVVGVGISILFGAFTGGAASYIFGPAFVVSAVIIALFGLAMPARTKKGVEVKEHILGLKEYMAVAESDRIKFHNAPEKNPEKFEQLLPYAMVLGVEKEWAKQFENIYKAAPGWYDDPAGGRFMPILFVSNLNSFSNVATQNMYSAPSSSGSGFSGGGFSGGGFGGGGGGSW